MTGTTAEPTGEVFRCADAARMRGDLLSGTAPPAVRWLLIEYPGPWSVDALAGSSIDTDVQALLQSAGRRAKARILLIRRPQRRASAAPASRQWMVLTRGSRTVTGSWRDDHDLRAAAQALDEPAPPSGPGEAGDPNDQLILVCAHGVHDLCCAVRGRSVARALAAAWPEQTWECSHVGGCRFAPNVVILPDGVYYGDLDPVSAGSVVRDHLAGVVRADHLRGFSGYPPPAQAAMNALYRQLDATTARRLRYRDQLELAPRRWRARFTLAEAEPRIDISVDVTAESETAARLTCRAARPTHATSYRVTLIEGVDQPDQAASTSS